MASVERTEYLKDTRTPCKYGFKCYQKNPVHQSRFKHPPPPTGRPPPLLKNEEDEPEIKRIKLDADDDDSECLLVPSPAPCDEPSKNVELMPRIDGDDDEEEEEEEELSAVSEDVVLDDGDFIKSRFLVEMPDDFYTFWNFCKEVDAKQPLAALQDVGLLLVGPYDVLAGKFKDVAAKNVDCLVHWRYFYDPPEFQTILKGDDKTGYHMGYFRDSPKESPCFVASNHAAKNCEFQSMGSNIFAAVNSYMEELKKSADPFKKVSITKLQSKLREKAHELKLNLLGKREITTGSRRSVAKTFHRVGISVPYNRKTQLGYRNLIVSEGELKKLLGQINAALPEQKEHFMSKLSEILTATEIAMDECDFGTGLELGVDIFCSGIVSLHKTALRFLTTAYNLLGRQEFVRILEAHLKNRKKGSDLSVL